MKCTICSSGNLCEHIVQERMRATLEDFMYYECLCCGCLQISDIPVNLGQYYSKEFYFSFNSIDTPNQSRSRLRSWIKKKRDAALLFQQRGLFSLIAQRYPNPGISSLRRWLSHTNVQSYDANILDVGCGNGQLLNRMKDLGFTNLAGADPFLISDRHEKQLSLFATDIFSIKDGNYDLIMLHHSFEHMTDHEKVLVRIKQLLADEGTCQIRIPIKSDGPWKKYGKFWAEWDAPRHLILHTVNSLHQVVKNAGLVVSHIEFEADPFPYLCSELYRKGLPLIDPITRQVINWNDVFSTNEIEQYTEEAIINNSRDMAGRGAFYLKKETSENPGVSYVLPHELQ